ncbi:MAG TPA: hypothetical protein VE338_02535 [Ktedonobacterales bacterium]|jgi:hypothetical protein|nr:hypothetical protein [Ktedonobacterales bacterium]
MWDSADSSDPDDESASDDWPRWDAETAEEQSTTSAASAAEDAEASEVISDAAHSLTTDPLEEASFAALLRSLRVVPGPCAPPIGEGAFDILYASAREIVVWFISAKDGAPQKEVAIPTRLAREAWEVIRRGEPVDAAMLRAIADGAAGGSWLLALFAQLPSIEVRSVAPDTDGASETVTLLWRGDADTTSRAS